MIVLAIDPGNIESAWVLYDTETRAVLEFGKVVNEELIARLRAAPRSKFEHLAIEMIASYGMPVGAEIFETCVWLGRFVEAWSRGDGLPFSFVFRREVKLHLCGQPRAKDPNIRQALLDRWGGKLVAMGTKRAPGPLYGVTADVWAALGVAVTFAETKLPQVAA